MPMLSFSPEKCTGCRACEVFCSFRHAGVIKPAESRIRVLGNVWNGFRLQVCSQCEDHPCLEACPVDAISEDSVTGAMQVDVNECIGCELCLDVCPSEGIRMSVGKALICDLCGGDPECVKVCAKVAIEFSEYPGSHKIGGQDR